MKLKKISFGTSTIQKLRRVALDQNLLNTLGLSVGDSVRIELDVEQESVIISKINNNEDEIKNFYTGERRVK